VIELVQAPLDALERRPHLLVPVLDSALPLWMRTADSTTKENSWRNSDCQFSSVDWPNCTR
jgi:hypothetical protein